MGEQEEGDVGGEGGCLRSSRAKPAILKMARHTPPNWVLNHDTLTVSPDADEVESIFWILQSHHVLLAKFVA